MATGETASCVACHERLQILVEPDDSDDELMEGSSSGEMVDDDVHLNCGCHFHWQCLLDAYSMTECPNCGKSLISQGSDNQQVVLCDLKNEGGIQQQLDILPLLTEESYLKAYPEERRCQAFLEFCGKGDMEAIVDLLADVDEETTDQTSADEASPDVLRYQDQIKTMNSGLHVAVLNQKTEVAWLLLLLASKLDMQRFPAQILAAAESFHLSREDQIGKQDIRNLRDADGLTPGQRADLVGGVWTDWNRSGLLGAE